MPFFRSKTPVKTLIITPEMLENNRRKLSSMKANKMAAVAMLHITNETIFKVSLETITESIKATKKVVKLGTREYKIGGKTEKMLVEFTKSYKAYEIAAIQMKMKMFPNKAEETLFEWIAKDEKERSEEKEEKRKAATKKAMELLAALKSNDGN